MSKSVDEAVKLEVEKRVEAAQKAAEGYLGLVDHGYPINVYSFIADVKAALKGEVVAEPQPEESPAE